MKWRYASVIIFFITVGSTFLYVQSKNRAPDLSGDGTSLIGRWLLERDRSSTEFSLDQLEFVDSHTLIVNSSENGQKDYNIRFQYDSIGAHRIKIAAPRRLSSDWEVNQAGNELRIRSSTWPKGIGVFRRSETVNWPLVAFLLGLCLLSVFFGMIPRPPMHGTDSANPGGSRDTTSLARLIRSTMFIAIFIVGVVVGVLAWSSPPLLRVQLPWDAVITMEFGAILFVFGIRTYLANRVTNLYKPIRWLYFLSAMVLGAGLSGILVGVARLFLFLETGFYP